MKYRIKGALGGGFGGVDRADWEYIDADDDDDAREQAYDLACDVYDSYDGLNGLLSIDAIMMEEGVNEDEAVDIYCDERESWLEYIYERVDIGLTEIIKRVIVDSDLVFVEHRQENWLAKTLAKEIRRVAKENKRFIKIEEWK